VTILLSTDFGKGLGVLVVDVDASDAVVDDDWVDVGRETGVRFALEGGRGSPLTVMGCS
jgi:hypothetical protein